MLLRIRKKSRFLKIFEIKIQIFLRAIQKIFMNQKALREFLLEKFALDTCKGILMILWTMFFVEVWVRF